MNYQATTPPADPTSEQCQDAIRKGLGRTRIWAESGTLDVHQLIHACTHDQRYDQQCEDSRSEWLWMVMRAGDLVETCEPAIWNAIHDLADDRNADQLCELAMFFALSGEERFKDRLVDIVRDKDLDDNSMLAEEEVIRLAGMDGFKVATARRGRRLQVAQWDWEDTHIVQTAIDQLGEETVLAFLKSEHNADVQRFHTAYRDQQVSVDENSERVSHQDRMRLISLDEVFAKAATQDRCFWLRGWGMYADQPDVDRVLETIVECEIPDLQARLLKVFMKRELPRIPDELFDYCQSDHDDLAFSASRALEGNRNSVIREFAFERLRDWKFGQAIDLLASNFKTGDESMIMQMMKIPDSDDERHSLMMSCRSILEDNPEASADPLAFLIYDYTPCSLCRTSAVKVLKRQGKVPVWMVDEVRFDCDEGTRQLFYPQPSRLIE